VTAALARLTEARNALEQSRSLEEVKAIHDVAVAAQRYAQACKLGEDSVRYAQEIVLRATRRMGEILAESPKHLGASAQLTPSRGATACLPLDTPPRLADIGITRNQSSRAQQIATLAVADFEHYIATATEVTKSGALKEARQAQKAERVAHIAEQPAAPIQSVGPFPVLYADPPWRYDDAEPGRKVENHYPTMTLDAIKALDVPAGDDAVLFLWTTSPKLREGVEVLEAWGFTYRTCAAWVKDRIGMGYYFRQQHELLLVGRRGSLPTPDPEDRPSSVIYAPRGEHSAKPETVYELLERMYPFLERCELFQRSPRDGWAGWGNQVGMAS
jgi:N6-adenosine-specific RNA methylase IME4